MEKWRIFFSADSIRKKIRNLFVCSSIYFVFSFYLLLHVLFYLTSIPFYACINFNVKSRPQPFCVKMKLVWCAVRRKSHWFTGSHTWFSIQINDKYKWKKKITIYKRTKAIRTENNLSHRNGIKTNLTIIIFFK